jgi:hypothetical protein
MSKAFLFSPGLQNRPYILFAILDFVMWRVGVRGDGNP